MRLDCLSSMTPPFLLEGMIMKFLWSIIMLFVRGGAASMLKF